MNLILHIARKDFLHLRWGLGAFWSVAAAKLTVGVALILGYGMSTGDSDRWEAIAAGAGVIEKCFVFVCTQNGEYTRAFCFNDRYISCP